MKIYEDSYAPNPRRVRIFLAEKGIDDVELVPVAIMNGEHKTPEFRTRNASMRLPVLELDDGTHIAESRAICTYFEAIKPEPPLMGVGAVDRALVEMWDRRMELELFLTVANCFRHTMSFMAALEQQIPEWGEVNKTRGQKRLKALDKQLADREFIAGERYSIADITALVAVDFGKSAGIEAPEDHANLRRWYDAVSARPSAKV